MKGKNFLPICMISILLTLNGCGQSASDSVQVDTPDSAESVSQPEVEEEQNNDKPENTGEVKEEEAEEVKEPEVVEDGGSGSDTAVNWAAEYLMYLGDFIEPERRKYALIYVNQDDVPELLLQGEDEATGNLVLTFDGNKIDELQTSRLYFTYLEKGNKLCNSDGHMGGYYDYVYSIVDGKWELIDYGNYYVEDNTNPDWSDEDLIFEWNGESVDPEEYEKALRRCYDSNKAIMGEGSLSYEEIVDKLKQEESAKEILIGDSQEVDDIYASYIDIVKECDNYKFDDWEITFDKFALIDFDGDDKPELFATGSFPDEYYMGGMQPYLIVGRNSEGAVINDVLTDGVASAGGYRGCLYYLPSIGKLHESIAWAPYIAPEDEVYIMKNGKIERFASGYFSVDQESLPDSMSEADDILNYGTWYWNGEPVDNEEYSKLFIEAIENTRGIALCDIECVGKDEILRELGGTANSN